MKRRYLKYVKIPYSKFILTIKCFVLDSTATYTSKLTGLNRNTINKLFQQLRVSIFKTVTNTDWLDSKGEYEVDESYFGATRVRGKRGRGASGKTIVFGLLKRDGLVYTQIIT